MRKWCDVDRPAKGFDRSYRSRQGTNLGQGQDSLSIDGTTLRVGAGNSIDPGVDVTITGAGTLDLGGTTVAVRDVTLDGGSILSGTLIGSSLNLNSGTVGAVLQSVTGLMKSGSNMVTLSAANTYLGDTTVSDGQLIVAADDALPAGTTLNIGSTGSVLLSSSLTKAVRYGDRLGCAAPNPNPSDLVGCARLCRLASRNQEAPLRHESRTRDAL